MPSLSDAYDIITSLSYINNHELALNFAKKKNFYDIDIEIFKYFSRRVEISESFVIKIVEKTLEFTRNKWPKLIKELPIPQEIKDALKQHWKNLNFKLF